MATDLSFDDKGNVRPKAVEAEGPEMENSPLTMSDVKGELNPSSLNKMQQTLGNQAVQRLIAQRSAEGAGEVDDETASAINSARGGGGKLDDGMAAKAGAAMGQDFTNVNVHTDSRADNLSRSVNAKAFTTGNDIFFKSGEYNPGSSQGQHLIAHELTHVVQQGASVPNIQGKMTVNDPNDAYEQEADSIADSIMKMDDDVAMKADIQRMGPEDDDLLQGKADLQREEVEEPEEEETPIMAKQDIQRHMDESELG